MKNPSKIQEIINEVKGVLIGSRAWGVENDKSDWDIVLTCNQQFIFCEKHNIKEEDILENDLNYRKLRNISNKKYIIDGFLINFICYEKQSAVDEVKKINELMKGLPKKSLENKSTRCSFFESFIEVFLTNEILGIPTIELNEDDIPFLYFYRKYKI